MNHSCICILGEVENRKVLNFQDLLEDSRVLLVFHLDNPGVVYYISLLQLNLVNSRTVCRPNCKNRSRSEIMFLFNKPACNIIYA